MRDILRQLAALEPSDVPVLSVYLDMRPQATGQNPALRSGRIVLKDRLREIEKTLGPRGPALESFCADAEHIERYLDEEAPAESQGIAIFACNAQGLFTTVPSGVAFQNQVSVSQLPDLFQLARLLDEQETAVVALADSNTARLFVTRTGFVEEVGGPDDVTVHYRKRATGGWSQARYQRHIEKHRTDFAQEAASQITQLVEREGATRLILAGDEVALTPLQAALTPQIADLVHGEPLRLDIRTSQDEVAEEVAPLLAQAEANDACSIGDRLVQAVQADGLGVVGLTETHRALDYGQADTLVLDPSAEIEETIRSVLIRQAAMTGADVEMVEGHTAFAELGGVGALLRYRLDGPTSTPAATPSGRSGRRG